MIVTDKIFESSISDLSGPLVIDIETSGLDPFQNSICGVGVGTLENCQFYFPFFHLNSSDNLDKSYLARLINRLNLSEVLIGHNIKFDLKFLWGLGLNPYNKQLIDTIVMARLTEAERFARLSLDGLVSKYYSSNYKKEFLELLTKNKWKKNYAQVPVNILGQYCLDDVKWTRQLYFDRKKQIEKTGQGRIWNIQIELTKCLLEMEIRGICIDVEYSKIGAERIEKRLEILQPRINEIFEKEINILSNKQLGEQFSKLGIAPARITDKGNASWDEGSLLQINHPVCGMISEYRKLSKYLEMYFIPWSKTKVVHTTYKNWGTVTGRLSSVDPDLQVNPRYITLVEDRSLSDEQLEDLRLRMEAYIRSKQGFRNITVSTDVKTWNFSDSTDFDENDESMIFVKRLFVPRPGHAIVRFDYSQMEVRVFLSYLQNEEISDLLRQSEFDFHNYVAKTAFGVLETGKNFKFYRQMSKSITFGLIYGIGLNSLSGQLNTSVEEAKKYRNSYFNNIKGSRQFINKVIDKVRLSGNIHNRYGRIYCIPREMGYVGINYLVQGTSADILSDRMIQVRNFLKNTSSGMLLQVHDELDCEIKLEELHDSIVGIRNILESNDLNIPLKTDISLGYRSLAEKIPFKNNL